MNILDINFCFRSKFCNLVILATPEPSKEIYAFYFQKFLRIINNQKSLYYLFQNKKYLYNYFYKSEFNSVMINILTPNI